jgi:acetyl-CoA carboxylase biotin carboxyl carrier protein
MKLHDIREVIKLVNQTSIEELVWEVDGTSITVKKAASLPAPAVEWPVPEPQAAEVNSSYKEAAATAETDSVPEKAEALSAEPAVHTILCPTVGTFTAAVAPGEQVKAGALVGKCTVEAFHLSEEIYSPVDGTVVDVLVPDGQLADYGKPLLVIQPN